MLGFFLPEIIDMDNLLQIFKSKMLFTLISVGIFIGLFILSPDIITSRLGKELWNLLHLVTFFVVWLFIISQYQYFRLDRLRVIVKIIVITLVASIIIETIQYFIGRSASLTDVGLNLAGTLFALLVFIRKNRFSKPKSYLVYLIIIPVIGFLLWPSSKVFIDEVQRRQDFPVLADFTKPYEVERWSFHNAELKIRQSEIGNVLQVTLLPGHKYSTVTLNTIAADWGKYRELTLVVMNLENKELPLTIRIHDAMHNNKYNDRYNKSRELQPGLSTISVKLLDLYKAPESRKMDLENIEAISLFASNLQSKKTFLIKKIYLR
jgi:hypothetical protein